LSCALNGGTLEEKPPSAIYESQRTTKPYDWTSDPLSLREIEKLLIGFPLAQGLPLVASFCAHRTRWYNPSMKTVTRQVRDIDSAERRVLEHVIGMPLRDNQQLVISIVTLESARPEGSLPPKPVQTLEDWTHIYDGLSEEEIQAIDQVVKTRANLSRDLP
jgi:hypothetical protein